MSINNFLLLFVVSFFSYLLIPMSTSVAGSCSGFHLKWGFAVFPEASFNCAAVKRQDPKATYTATARGGNYYVATSNTMLSVGSGDWYWRKPVGADFKVKSGFSSVSVWRKKDKKSGVNCFEANITDTKSVWVYFCDASRKTPFDKASFTAIWKDRKEYGFLQPEKPAPKKNNPPNPSPTKSKLERAKGTCTELGFALGTEKYGDCVMKILE